MVNTCMPFVECMKLTTCPGSSKAGEGSTLCCRPGDYYLEKLSETEGIVDLGISFNLDVWAIIPIDVIWVQPTLGTFDDASRFVTISEVNTFMGSLPVD